MIANILSIAGTDPSGGAGIQADLKAISACGGYGMSVITCLVAQNTQGVQHTYPIAPDFILKQLDSVLEDISVDAVKIGMLGTAEIVKTVAKALKPLRCPIVIDPVMLSKSGHRLLEPDAVEALKSDLLPLARLLTPNLPEAADLLDAEEATSEAEMTAQGKDILAFGSEAVLMKGGHFSAQDTSPDLLITQKGVLTFPGRRWETKNTHGTGCSLSAALATFLGQGLSLQEAVMAAKTWLSGAIAHADLLTVGKGCGPVHHFYALWEDAARKRRSTP